MDTTETITYSTIEEINSAIESGELDRDSGEESIEEAGLNGYVWAEDSDQYIDEDDAHFCDESGLCFESDDDFREIVTGIRYGSVTDTINVHKDYYSDYFECEKSGLYFNSNKFSEVEVEGDSVCYEYNMDDLYHWDSDDEYHWEPEPEEEEANIPEYHSEDRPDEWHSAAGYGLELEVYTDDPEYVHGKLPEGFLGEGDGSIDEAHGIEIIGYPMEFQEIVAGKNGWNEVMNILDLDCATIPSNSYGLHVNISNSLFEGELHRAKFVVAINYLKKISQIVSRRENIYSGSYDLAKKVNKHTKLTSKYEPVSVKNNRLEVRTFKSTVNYSDIVVAVEYCELVKEMTRGASILDLGSPEKAVAYFNSYIKKTAGFKNLKKFLQEQVVLH
jgi:hypothetical protein